MGSVPGSEILSVTVAVKLEKRSVLLVLYHQEASEQALICYRGALSRLTHFAASFCFLPLIQFNV